MQYMKNNEMRYEKIKLFYHLNGQVKYANIDNSNE